MPHGPGPNGCQRAGDQPSATVRVLPTADAVAVLRAQPDDTNAILHVTY
jgi:hypothetical protein